MPAYCWPARAAGRWEKWFWFWRGGPGAGGAGAQKGVAGIYGDNTHTWARGSRDAGLEWRYTWPLAASVIVGLAAGAHRLKLADLAADYAHLSRPFLLICLPPFLLLSAKGLTSFPPGKVLIPLFVLLSLISVVRLL